jgi:hypothetical protein
MTDTTTKVREHYNATGLPVASPHCSRITVKPSVTPVWEEDFRRSCRQHIQWALQIMHNLRRSPD